MTSWPDDEEYPEEWVRKAHEELMNRGGMLGVVYRRQVKRVRELRAQLKVDCNDRDQ